MKVKCLSIDSSSFSEVELNSSVFGCEVRSDIIKSVINWQNLNNKFFFGSAKNRSDVAGSQIKLFRQKGTGNARTGNAKSPHKRSGGVAMGPVNRLVRKKLPKKVKKLGLLSALSLKAKENLVSCIGGVSALDKIKTSSIASVFSSNFTGTTLVIADKSSVAFVKSVSNIKGLNILPVEGLNVRDIIRHKNIVISADCMDKIEERFNVQ